MKALKTAEIGTFVILGVLLAGSTAFAHPRLVQAGPAPGSTVAVSPKSVRIQFNEAFELKFTGIDVKNQAGMAQALGAPSVDAKDDKLLVVPVTSPLAPGVYTVTWHSVGDDTHRVEGHYDFTVKP